MFMLDHLASSTLCNFSSARHFDPGDMLFHSCRLILKSQFSESESNNDVEEVLSLLEKFKPDFIVISSCCCFFATHNGLCFSAGFFVVC